jgi:hypothetical protein
VDTSIRIVLFLLCLVSLPFCSAPQLKRTIETGRLKPEHIDPTGNEDAGRSRWATPEAPSGPTKNTRGTRPNMVLSDSQLSKIADQIFKNEAAGNREMLAYWSPNEDFPSLGIGHFIWFPANASKARARFGADSFPQFLRFVTQQRVSLPPLLARLSPGFVCPWPNRSAFQNMRSSDREALLKFLSDTKHLQMKHILSRFMSAREAFKNGPDGTAIAAKIDAISQSPSGIYPVIDYVNFKGEGKSSDKTSWGLWNVLAQMRSTSPDHAHKAFAEAAETVLRNRVNRHPGDRVFLDGWTNRIQTYRDFRL